MGLLVVFWLGSLPVINEILYDPPGPDGGGEFVELVNPGPDAVILAGYRLEFANGAEGPVWQVRWTGSAADTLAPGGLFLVADAGWTGSPPDAEVPLSLQNGPDALRLVGPAGVADLVGWGDLAHPSLSEGAPADDPSGQALARRPDGQDSDRNREDLHPADPTPGATNWPAFAPRLQAWSWQPPSLAAPGQPLQSRLELRNDGHADLAGCRLRLVVGDVQAPVTLTAVPPGSTTSVQTVLRPTRAGRLAARLTAIAPAGGDSLVTDLGHVQVGLAALRLSEVMAAPVAGGEWVEIINHDRVPRSLGELALRDEDGAWRGLPDRSLAPGELVVLAQDPEALIAWLDDLAAAGVAPTCPWPAPEATDGWPSLNNTAPPGRPFADRLYLGTIDGDVLDHVTLGLGSGQAPAGRSFERRQDGTWWPATAPAGATPGCPPPSGDAASPGELTLTPNPFSPAAGEGAVTIRLTVPPDGAGYELRIYDLWGQRRRDLGGDHLGPGPREVRWDGRDDGGRLLPAGGYVVVALWRRPDGGTWPALRRLAVLREATR
jgi:hypothetical protein